MSLRHTKIGEQLFQGGMNAGQAWAIAKWMADLQKKQSTEIGPNSPEANDPDWLNQFRPPESPDLPSGGDIAGEDGITGNYPGGDGTGGDQAPPWQPGDMPPAGTPAGDTINTIGDTLKIVDADMRLLFQMISEALRRIGELEFKVNGMQARLAALGRLVNQHQTKLSNHENRLDALEQAIAECCGIVVNPGRGEGCECDAFGQTGMGNGGFRLATTAPKGFVYVTYSIISAGETADITIDTNAANLTRQGLMGNGQIRFCKPTNAMEVLVSIKANQTAQWTLSGSCPNIGCDPAFDNNRSNLLP